LRADPPLVTAQTGNRAIGADAVAPERDRCIPVYVTGTATFSGTAMLGTILLIILIILLVGALPTWPYSGGWGYYPSGGAGLLVLIVILLLVFGRI
jgi:hypothetical protein